VLPTDKKIGDAKATPIFHFTNITNRERLR
jgi:hypothetical protein